MATLQSTGERQVGTTLDTIRADHRERYIWAAKRLTSSARVLDAGCGVGYGSQLLAAYASSIHAVDVDTATVAYAQRYWSHHSVTHVCQDIHYLELQPQQRFDVIVAFEIIEHLIEPRLFLLRARQLLEQNGRLLLSVPNEKLVPHTVDLNPFHLRHYTIEEISSLLNECGFTICEVCSQSGSDISASKDGKVLIFEAKKTNSEIDPMFQNGVQKNAISLATYAINVRAVALARAKKDVNSLRSKLEECSKQVMPSERAPTSSTQLLDALSTRVASIESGMLSDLRQRMCFLEATERTARDASVSAQLQAMRLESELSGLKNRAEFDEATIAALRRDLEDGKAEVYRLRSEEVRCHAELSVLRGNLGESQHKVSSLAEKLERRSAEVNDLADQLQRSSTKYDELTEQLERRNAESESLVEQLEQRNGELNGLAEQLQRRHAEFNELSELLERRNIEFNHLNERLEKRDVEFNDLAEQLEWREVESHDLVERLELKSTELVRLVEQLEERNSDFDSLAKQLKLRDAEFGRLSQQLEDRNEEFNCVTKKLEYRSTEKQNLGKQLEQRDAELARLVDVAFRLQECEKKVSEGKIEIQVLEAKLAEQKQANLPSTSPVAKTPEVKQPPRSKCSLPEAPVPSSQQNNLLLESKQNAEKINRLSQHLVMAIKENEILVKANEDLAIELERARSVSSQASAQQRPHKEPPSIGYVWRKLKFHKLYGPFLLKAVKNSLGISSKTKKAMRVRK